MSSSIRDVLRIENLSIQFGGLKAVDDLSFSVGEGQVYGLIGPNGAGKTTVFNCITQFNKPNAGAIWFNTGKEEINLIGLPVHEIIRHGLVRTFQNVEAVRELSVIDNILIGAHISFKATILEQALKLPRARREEREIREKAECVLDSLGITDRKDLPAGGQPYGVLKKMELARTLMCSPRLIILDEPAAGLNDSETDDLAGTIRKIRDDYLCSILLVEHDMRLVMGVCDRICAISFGKLLAIGAPDEIKVDKRVQEAYLGEEEVAE